LDNFIICPASCFIHLSTAICLVDSNQLFGRLFLTLFCV